MKKLEQKLSKILFLVVSLVSLFCTVTSCNSWMEDDGFFEDIEGEVKYANAPEISVFVRYAAPKMGTTDPNGNITFKVGITKEVTATTESSYGFWKWAAFSTEYLSKEYHQDFCFVDEESYEADILPHELGDEIVHFSDRTSPSTQITINEKRDDIFIIPVVANRPAANTSLPGPGQSNVIKNSAIRIFFSKSMDLDSFKNEEGVYDTIQVLQSSQNITADGSLAVVSEDISDRFEDPSFSTDGKTLTLKFTSAALTEGFTSGSYVSVIVSHEVKDVYGYEMTDDFKLSFQVGSKFDTLAPRITALTAGIAQQYNTFGSMYKDAGTVTNMGSYTQITNTAGASAANGNIDNSLYTENILAQRVNNRLNIRVYAEDISGSGSDQNPMGAENDVSAIGILANSLVLMDGTASPNDEEHKIPFKSIAYVPQKNDTDIPGTYKSITGTTNGCLFTYDLSSLPDGLIEIRVWAYDSVGNAGNSEGGYYSSEYGNGYASIFVVKDTTAPDAISNLSNIDSSSVQAPYHWYNAASLSSMQIYEKSAGAVIDSGHQKLRSKSENLKWMFKVTDGTSWGSEVTPATDGWVNTSAGYSISNASIPSQDGAIALSMILMDDIGNISEVAPISSIVYDNTAPVVSDMSWVTPDGIIARNTTSTQVIDGTSTLLKVPFTEVSSGIRRIKVTIKNSNNENYATPLAASSFKVRYAADSSVLPGNATELQIIPETGTTTDNLFVLAEPETAPITSGILYISDLKIDSPDGVYSIVVELYDASLNVSASKTITIANDTTAPVINSVVINDVVSSTSYDGVTKTWLPASNYVDGNPSAVKLTINTTEMGSGIEIIKLENKASITAQTRIEGLEIGTDYVIEGDTIRLLDTYNPKIIGANKVIVLTNVILLEPNGNNPVDVRLIDFAYKSVDSANAASVYADNTPPVITDNVILSDISGDSQNVFTSDSSNYSPLMYTNNNTVNINIPLGTAETIGAGVKSINISNATVSLPAFAIYVNDTTELVKGTDYTISGSDTVIFAKPFTNEVVVNFKNIQFTDSLNQIHTVSVKATDLTGWESTVITSSQIWLDTIAPVFSEEMYFTADGSSTVGAINSSILANQILHLKFTEVTSGLKSIRIHVTKDGTTSTTLPFNNPSLQVMIDGSVVPYTVNGEVLTFETPAKTGELTIKGLRISDTESIDTDGTFTIKASLLDASQNSNAEADKSISIVKDTIAPAVGAVSVDGAVNDWVKNDTVTIRFTVTENGTGVSYISLGNNAQITSLSTLVIDGVPETATADVTNNRMVLPNARTLSNAVIQITNVSLTEALDAPNTIRVTVYDNVTNNQYNEKTDIKKDGTAPSITSVTIKDASSGSSDYTNNHLITMEVSIPAGETSGLKSLTVTGAEFTSSTAVTGTTLTPTFDGLTVTFGTSSGTTAQVIEGSSAVTLTFTNVSIPEGDASKLVSVVATDLVGNTTVTAVSSNAIILDETKPVSNSENITWIPPAGSVAGVFRGTVMDEILQVPFTDAPAGIVKIQMDITNVNATYTTPFADSDFALTYIDASGTEQALAKDTDYTVSGNIITLNAPYTTGTFTFKNLKVSDTEVEGEYTFAVIFTDAAENVMDSSASKTANNDSTAPEVEEIFIPGIKEVKTINNTQTTFTSEHWIDNSSVESGIKTVTATLTIIENNSGVRKLVFTGTGLNSIEGIVLKKVNGVAEDIIPSDKYTITNTATEKSIYFDNSVDALIGTETDGSFIIRIEGIKFNGATENNLSVIATDVALNESLPSSEIKSDNNLSVSSFRIDKEITSTTQIKEIKDRGTAAGTDTFEAATDFTNEKYVNLKIYGTLNEDTSGLHKITLTGATFVTDNTGNNTQVIFGDSNYISIAALNNNIAVSYEDSNTSIVFKSKADNSDVSIKGSYYLEIKNINLGDNDGSIEVKVDSITFTGFSDSKKHTINLDTQAPQWVEKGVYAPIQGTASRNSKVYPNPSAGKNTYGAIIPQTIGSNTVDVSYFYTAYEDSGNYKCKLDGAISEENPKNISCIYFRQFTASDTDAINHRDISKFTWFGSSGHTFNASEYAYQLMAVDNAGNYSDVIPFYVVKEENDKSCIDVADLYNRITLVKPDASADIYRIDRYEDTTIKDADIKYQDSGDSFNIYAYKTVIKSTSDNYVIKVKMGSGLVDSDKKIFGGSVTPTSSSFTNYNPTTTHSPVTAYTITHYYRHWADKYDGQRTFEPKFPDETYNFILQSYFNSAPSYGWMNDSDANNNESTTSNCTWHEMSKRNVPNIDDQISSYVDENGDINIKIPTTGKIPPLTLLLKNGTGQLNYVYLTELSSGRTLPDAWNDVTTWEVDNKLGGAEVDDRGKTRSRSIVMNPISSEDSSGSESWGTVKYKWGSQAGTTAWESSNDGNSTTGFAIKNKVNKTTYYTNGVKAGLFIDAASGHNGASESITFTLTEYTDDEIRSAPATSEQIAAGEYTARAKLYCTTSSTAPTYSTIVNTSEDNGQVTPWCYVRTKSGKGTVFFMDYPHPNYTALNWSPKEPYYIYYLVEDRVGNYEIETVVNSHSDTEMVKWLYDAEGPKVTLRGKTTSPASVTSNVSELVPNHNGYQAYYDGSKYYTWWSTNPTGTYNDAQGKGTTRTVGGAPERKNAPFFDIDVTDDSGIRAFAYSDTYIENPEVSTFSFYTAEQGEKTWFGGQGSPTKDTIIGESWTDPTYNDAGKYKVLKENGTEDTSYNDVYTGAAVCSVLPLYEATLTGKVLYLYVMDWVGNISCTKMGGYSWNIDITPPSANSTKESYSDKYYINSAGTLEFAGKKVAGLTSTKVYLPSDFYTDSGSSVLGWSLTQNKVDSIQKDSTGSYIELTLSDYNETATPKTVYVYDGVGNCKDYSYNISKDSTPPSYNLYVRSNGSSTTGSLYVKDVGYNQHGHNDHPKNYLLPDDLNLTTRLTESLYTDEASIKANSYYVYTDENGITFLPNSSEVTANSKIDIFKWSGTQWNKVSSYTSTNSTGGTFQIETNWCTCPTIQVDGTNAGYFCFALSDRAGNTNYAYVYAKKDVTPPAVETICTNVNTIGGTNYYGPYGSVKYKVTQYDSGIYQINTEDPLSTYTTEVGPRNYVGTSNPYSVVVYNNNRKGETVNLKWNSVSNWSYDYSTPSCGSISSTKQYIANNYYSQANRDIPGVDVTRKQGEGYSSITISSTNTSHVSTISATGVSSFKINNVSNFVGSSNTTAWKVITSTSGVPAKPDFVRWEDKDLVYNASYTFNSSDWTDKSYYFYPINNAGTVGDPIIFTFETPIKPTVTKESVTGDYNNASQIYFKESCNASLKIQNPSTSKAISVTGYFLYAKDSGNYSYITEETFAEPISINQNNFNNYELNISDIGEYNGKEIYVQIKTNYTVSDYVSIGYLVKDSTAPSITDISCTAANTYIDSTNKKIYFNSASLSVKVISNDTDVDFYKYGTNTSATGEFTLGDGSYTFYAVDKVGNESSPYTITLIKDSLPPATPSGTLTFYNDETQVTTGYVFDSENNTVLFNPNIVTKVVFTPSAQTDDAATAGDGLGSGIKGYSGSRTATEWTATVTSALSSTDSGKEYKFYSCDKVGNVCESSLKYTFTADSTGPQPSGTIKNDPLYGSFKTSDTPTIKGIYVSMTDVPATIAYDDIVGNNYATLIYNAGTTFNVELTDSDCVEYAFTCGCDSSATTQPTSFTSITPVGTTITVPMPESKLPHYYIFLWLKDSVGNVSVYNLIQDKDGEKNWWLSEDTTPNITYSYNSINGNLTISGLTCIPLKNVSISGNNINISTYSITFDYNIPTNYLNTKSYAKNISWSNNFGTLSDSPQLTGSGTIVINIGNAASDIAVTINSENGSGGVIAIPNAASPINQFASAIVSTVRTIFTPKTKKIYLTSEVETKVVEKETGVISQNNQPVLTKNASPKKNKNTKVRKNNDSNNVLESSVVKNTVTQKKNTVIPEGAKVLEVTSIENMTNLSVASTEIIETSGVETTVVKNDSEVSNKDNSKLVYGIIAIVMCAVIAMVVIVNKVLVDKTK